jgi:hypothetical protein
LLKYNGGDSGIKISILYWRCSLISVRNERSNSISFVMSVYPSEWDHSAPTGESFIRFHIRVFFGNLSMKLKFN